MDDREKRRDIGTSSRSHKRGAPAQPISRVGARTYAGSTDIREKKKTGRSPSSQRHKRSGAANLRRLNGDNRVSRSRAAPRPPGKDTCMTRTHRCRDRADLQLGGVLVYPMAMHRGRRTHYASLSEGTIMSKGQRGNKEAKKPKQVRAAVAPTSPVAPLAVPPSGVLGG